MTNNKNNTQLAGYEEFVQSVEKSENLCWKSMI